jgi:pyridoxamine 5'-phosphate oxidase
MSIADLRREYSLGGMRRQDLEPNPIAQFEKWFDQAIGARAGGRWRRFFIKLYKTVFLLSSTGPIDANAMVLATVDAEGRPSARVVLLKGVDQRGFIFFTNYESRKGQELASNRHAALVFYWADQERQVCIAGTVSKLPDQESEAYFRSRPRGSQLAAWASNQTSVVADREVLDHNWKDVETRFAAGQVPKPPYWGGYLLSPHRLEFWQGRPNRLHDRFRYTRQGDDRWQIERLAP